MNKKKAYYINIFIIMGVALISFYGFREALPKRLFTESKPSDNTNILVDSLMLAAMNDTTEFTVKVDTIPLDTVAKHEYRPVLSLKMESGEFNPEISVDGYQNLQNFYAKLEKLENTGKGKVRVAYFGDSMNDGDFVVQDVRSLLQGKYGGSGVGLVGITSLSSNARGSVRHQHSKSWNTQSFVKVKKPDRPFGIDGQVHFMKKDGDWVKYKAQGQANSTSLYNPTLFYGRSSNDSAYVDIKYGKEEVLEQKELSGKNLINTLKLSPTTQNIELAFHKADSIPLYVCNFDNGSGVHVDNFSLRGNSGLPLSTLNAGLISAFDRILNYDLIVLQYGANVLSTTTKSYNWYERNMGVVVRNLRACFPNADILVISTADKATKLDGEMQTDPAVALLAIAQRNYATSSNSGFVNLYDLMGGEGSMIEWVDKGQGSKDYTHFSISGSRKIGNLLFKEIEKGFEKYKQNLPIIDEEDENN